MTVYTLGVTEATQQAVIQMQVQSRPQRTVIKASPDFEVGFNTVNIAYLICISSTLFPTNTPLKLPLKFHLTPPHNCTGYTEVGYSLSHTLVTSITPLIPFVTHEVKLLKEISC